MPFFCTFYFRFPLKNPQLLKLWVHHVRRKNWKPNANSRLCSDHFGEDDYKCKQGAKHRWLKEDAVPSQFSFNECKKEPRRKVRRIGKEDALNVIIYFFSLFSMLEFLNIIK